MKAAWIEARGAVRVAEVDPPELIPGTALVRPLLVGLNETDNIRVYRGSEADYPLPAGSSAAEVIGVVEATAYVGKKALPFAVDEVALVRCSTQDGLAEQLLVPLPQLIHQTIATAPEQLVLAHQLGEVLMLCERLRDVVGLTVAVLGQGPAGLIFDRALRRMGARSVVALDPNPARRQAGRAFGATAACDPEDPDVEAQVAAFSATGLPDVVVEATGSEASIGLAVCLVAEHGRLVLCGHPHTPVVRFPYATLLQRACSIVIGAHSNYEQAGYHAYRLALNAVARDDFELGSLLTHRLPLADVGRAYQLAETGAEGALKIAIDFR